MKKRKIASGILATILVLSFVSCAREQQGNMQNNLGRSYSVMDFIDQSPALKEMLQTIEPQAFNDALSASFGSMATDDTIRMMNLLLALLNNPETPLTDSLTAGSNLVDRLVNQDSLDNDPYNDYARDFFALTDRLAASGSSNKDQIFALSQRMIGYLNYANQKDPELLKSDLRYLQALLKAEIPVAQGEEEADVFKAVGDAATTILLKNERSAQALDDLLINLSLLTKDQEFASSLGDLARAGADLTTLEILDSENNAKRFSRVLRELLCEIDAYYLKDGDKVNQYKDSTSDAQGIYKDSEIVDLICELAPEIAKTSVKLKDAEGKESYFLADMAGALQRLNLNYADLQMEKSLQTMVTRDVRMRPLQAVDLAAQATGKNLSTRVSYLDSYLFLAIAAANYGWYDENDWDPDANRFSRPTDGVITLNNSLLQAGVMDLDVLGMHFNTHRFGLNNPGLNSSRIFRSHEDFTYNTSAGKEYYVSCDVPSIALATGNSVGDIGLPEDLAEAKQEKKQRSGDVKNYADKNAFRGFDPKGIKADNSATYGAGWMARLCWMGEGPYYAEEGSVVKDGKKYYYAADGKTVYAYEDADGNFHEQTFKQEWQTDAFLVKMYAQAGSWGFFTGKHDHFIALGDFYNVDKFELNVNQDNTNKAAGRLTYREIVKNADGSEATWQDRKCATQVDAMYKNFQWMVYYKKMVFILPMLIDAVGSEWFTVYGVVEGNGILGIAHVAKNAGNGRWHYDNYNGGRIFYHHSTQPGDYRLTLVEGHTAGDIDYASKFYSALGDGCLAPPWIAKNTSALERMAMFNTEVQHDISPAEAITPEKVDQHLDQRNGLFPIIVTSLGLMREKSTIENNVLDQVIKGLLPKFQKAIWYEGKTQDGRYTMLTPRMKGTNIYLPSNETSTADYYEPLALRTLMSTLIGSEMNKTDGLLPLVGESQLLSNLFKTMAIAGQPENEQIRENIGSSLESLMSAVAVDNPSAEQINLRHLLTTIVYDTVDPLVDKHNDGVYDWAQFERLLDTCQEFVSDEGQTAGKYNILEDLIMATGDLFTKVDFKQQDAAALRHTAGMIFASYEEDQWQQQNDVSVILRKELPVIIDASMPYLDDALKNGTVMFEEDGLIKYLFDNLSCSYGSEEVFNELNDLLKLDNLQKADSDLWNDLSGMLEETIDLMQQKTEGSKSNEFRLIDGAQLPEPEALKKSPTLLDDPYNTFKMILNN